MATDLSTEQLQAFMDAIQGNPEIQAAVQESQAHPGFHNIPKINAAAQAAGVNLPADYTLDMGGNVVQKQGNPWWMAPLVLGAPFLAGALAGPTGAAASGGGAATAAAGADATSNVIKKTTDAAKTGLDLKSLLPLVGLQSGLGLLSGLFAPGTFQQRQSFSGNLSAPSLLGKAVSGLDAAAPGITNPRPVTLRGAQAPSASFGGGALPWTFGVQGSTPDLEAGSPLEQAKNAMDLLKASKR